MSSNVISFSTTNHSFLQKTSLSNACQDAKQGLQNAINKTPLPHNWIAFLQRENAQKCMNSYVYTKSTYEEQIEGMQVCLDMITCRVHHPLHSPSLPISDAKRKEVQEKIDIAREKMHLYSS